MSRKVAVQCSKDFAREATSLIPDVKVQHVSQKEIDDIIRQDDPWQNVEEFQGIRKVHCMLGERNGEVCLFTYSNGNVVAEYMTRLWRWQTERHLTESRKLVCGCWAVVRYDGKEYPGEVAGKK